ncbi:1,4-beta-N-acetylmuramidase [Paramagnetospirillum kuznetsovii]|uniref:1,4-beta-N-acetylmuramidase n=1 Tax=Paramagnetospirillum kuznetsovii TaxID=2053833 RepID=A0A364NSD6_9PROT|nr:1,4-beta-N-acetylmuramidase [Paramagnetospirillum kuznetsovii]
MFTRRTVLTGLFGLTAAAAGVVSRPTNAVAAKSGGKLDAVIDISHSTTVNDFRLARQRSNILGVIHKASEGGDWRDPLYVKRRAEAEAVGLLWGAYHFGTHEYSGADQAAMFLNAARPGPSTLMALDLEFNEQNPSNTMRLRQAEEFVKSIVATTGRHPMIYTTAAWADGEPMGHPQYRLGGRISEHSILANCPLWLADYRFEPQLPSAWRGKGWHFWQYAGDTDDGGPRGHRVRSVSGVVRCDRNLFKGDATMLHKFWTASAGNGPTRRKA